MIKIITFNSEAELYARLKPALNTKKTECHRLRLTYISEADIWNYLKHTTWASAKNLDLSKMVSDILNAPIERIDKFVKMNLYKQREARLEEQNES